MFAYLYFKGVRTGILDRKYQDNGRKAIDGIKRVYLTCDENGIYHLDGNLLGCRTWRQSIP